MARLNVTDDDYDLLTEEERLGLKEYQAEIEAAQAAEDAEIAAAAAGDPEDEPAVEEPPAEEEPDEEAEEEPAEPEEPPAEGEEEADEEVGDDEEEVDAEDDETLVAAPSVPAVKLTDAEEKRLVAIDKLLDGIAEKFDEGEITAKEMRDQQKSLIAELDDLKDKRTMSKVTTQTAVNTWYQSTIPLFMAQHEEYKDGSLRHDILDTVVRKLQIASTNPTDPKILYEAHKRIVAEFGAVEGAEPVAKKKKKANGNGAKRETPPNFSSIPASDQTVVTIPNKFARLDKLNGVDYERALAKLTPADREAYLLGG